MQPDLAAQYRAMSAEGTFPGRSVVPFAPEIARIVHKTASRTLLDYGCGGGRQYTVDAIQMTWGIMPTLYDPGVARFAARPAGTFDGVICCDVLEHVPEPDVPATIADVFGFARRFVFLAVCCREASKLLLDGRNAHLTVRPAGWWEWRIAPHRRDGLLTRLLFTP